MALLAVCSLAAGCGTVEDEQPPRYRPSAVDLVGLDALPGGLDSVPTAVGRYLVHVPEQGGEPFGEIAFALADGDEMYITEYGVPGATENWLRVGFVQDVDLSPLGTRYLEPGDFIELRVDGIIDGVTYRGRSTEAELRVDLRTGAIQGHFNVEVAAVDGAADGFTLAAHLQGVLERRCVTHVYRPDASIDPVDVEVVATGGDCDAVFEAIDAQPTQSDGPRVPPGFSPSTTGS